MRNFIANSACRGRKPRGLGLAHLCSRPRLLKKMMADRGVARFIVAPRGFGKSTLACEYAESIFRFEHVFWINGQSPCFLRDLDDRIVVSSLLEESSHRSLVVFEDIPYLDDVRSDALSEDIDALLAKEWEVVVTATPAIDSFSERQNDRCCITACDLLVDDSELEGSDPLGCGGAPCHRVPAFVWGDDAGAEVLEGMRSPDMPAEIQLALFVMEVLVEGSLDEVAAFAHGFRKDTRRFIEQHYPYAGVDLVEERFSVHEFPISRIAAVFRGAVDPAISRASSLGRDAFISRLANVLARDGRYGRACELMAALCPRRRRACWIESEQGRFFSVGEIEAMQTLFESLGERPSGLTPALLIGAAQRLFLLGDGAHCKRFATRAFEHPACTQEQACVAALIACSCASDDFPLRAQAILSNAAARSIGHAGALSCAAEARAAIGSDPARAVAVFEGASDEACVQPAFMAELAHAIRFVRDGEASSGPASLSGRLHALAGRSLASYRAGRDEVDIFEAVVCDALGEDAWKDQGLERAAATEALLAGLARQRRRRAAPAPAASRRFAPEARASDTAPVMDVRLFGGMKISIGGSVLDSSLLRKQKAKTLLAVLVLHRGKEMARREILDIIWPESSGERAINNFYSLWSALRRALDDGRGNCPYIVRHQTSCMVDARYVKSDVDEFEDLCRTLFFGRPDAQAWMEIFTRLQDDFSCDLLPSETDNAYIEHVRRSYRCRLVDAYTAAAERLCDIGEPQTALWFAHAAFEKSGRREDVYCALMRAQMLSDQRSLAMETFMECKDFMVEELGMDPSARMMRLHRELISGARDGSLVSKEGKRSRTADVLK